MNFVNLVGFFFIYLFIILKSAAAMFWNFVCCLFGFNCQRGPELIFPISSCHCLGCRLVMFFSAFSPTAFSYYPFLACVYNLGLSFS